MRKTIVEKGAEPAAGSDLGGGPDQDPDGFPRLWTKFANGSIAKCWPMRFLVAGSPAFRLMMFGTSISMLGSRISTVAFPMLVLHLNNSPLVVGLVTFAAIAPSMLVYVPAGVLVDRWNPRRVMLISESLRGVTISSVVAALILFGWHLSIWFLICAMMIEEILEIFSVLADRRYLTRLIEQDKIAQRQASIEVRTHTVVVAGRPVGIVLFIIEPFLPFLADAVSFVASITILLLLRGIKEQPAEARRRVRRRISSDIDQGFRWLKQDRRARLTILLMAITSMVAQALILMFMVLAHSRQLSTLAIGSVVAASGVGGAVGSFWSRIVLSAAQGFWLPIQMATWSAALAFLALTGGQSAYWSSIVMFILGFTGAIGNIEFGTYLVRNVPDDMIAKVTGIGQMLAIGACALGPVLGGYAIQRFQVKGAIGILVIIAVGLAIIAFLIPEISERLRRDLDSFRDAVMLGGAIEEANPGTATVAATMNPTNGDPELGSDDSSLIVWSAKPPGIVAVSLRAAYPASQGWIREESGGFRKYWYRLARSA